MNFVFFGTPDFAAIILQKLIDNKIIPSLIITNPDKPVGRKKIMTPPPVKIIAKKYNLKCIQPEKLNSNEIKQLGEYQFGILAAYGKIIPFDVINIFSKGIIVIHPSLLPKYRGPTPIQSVILNNEKETGTTLFLMDEKVDHGPIIAQQKYILPDNINFQKLHNDLANLSADLLIKTLPEFLNNNCQLTQQNDNDATYTKKFNNEDAFIKYEDLEKAQIIGGNIAQIIDKKIKALNPEPGTYTIDKNNKRIKLLDSEIKNNKLKLNIIQKEGKKPTKL
ncbi:MAG: methionyl-tRNA formyltransferase [Minisyncoccia bacterium]